MIMNAVSGDFNEEVKRLVGTDSKIAFAVAVTLEGVRNSFVRMGLNHDEATSETRQFVTWRLTKTN